MCSEILAHLANLGNAFHSVTKGSTESSGFPYFISKLISKLISKMIFHKPMFAFKMCLSSMVLIKMIMMDFPVMFLLFLHRAELLRLTRYYFTRLHGTRMDTMDVVQENEDEHRNTHLVKTFHLS